VKGDQREDHLYRRTLPQEVFGPVQVFQVFESEDKAVELANDTDYGLSACVWSRDADRPMRVARRISSGLISINSWANLAVEFEEGGWKASGLGRLGGLASLDDFLEYKQITQDYGAATFSKRFRGFWEPYLAMGNCCEKPQAQCGFADRFSGS
jgi:acyl-CoA reductase-like NAD-dependent aldehyde dehydrogenase